MTDHKSKKARALADATARVSDQSGRLVGEATDHATGENAAHWVAVYTELLAFKAELLEITAKRRVTMSHDARGEAEADEAVIGAQADKYTRRLREWRGHLDESSTTGGGAPIPALFVKGQPRRLGHLLIDPWTRTVMSDGETRQLTHTEWHLLQTFLERPGEILSRTQLAAAVWPDGADGLDGPDRPGGTDGTDAPFGKVEVSVSRLRRKLEYGAGAGDVIETVRGTGYRLTVFLEAGDPQV